MPALLGYAPSEVSAAVGDQQRIATSGVILMFIVSALGANICYTFAYALEFIFATENPNARWPRVGRKLCFVSGVTFAMALAFIGGRNIHIIEYSYK